VSDTVTFDNALKNASPVAKRTRLCLDGELLSEIERLGEELTQLPDGSDDAQRIASEIVEKTERAVASQTEFVFQAIGRRAWRELAEAHPPTEEQRAKGAEFDTESFPIAAMGASCITPKGATEAKFRKLAEGFTDAQWNQLWLTCHAANTSGGEIQVSIAALALAKRVAAA
jgi:hypothetical protein